MEGYKKYIIYAFYDECRKFIAVVKNTTPNVIVNQLKQYYDEVRFE